MDNCHTIPTKWTKIILSVFGLTVFLAVFSLYKFYVTAPYAFADREKTLTQLSLLREEIRVNKERYEFLTKSLEALTESVQDSSDLIRDQLQDIKNHLPKQ